VYFDILILLYLQSGFFIEITIVPRTQHVTACTINDGLFEHVTVIYFFHKVRSDTSWR